LDQWGTTDPIATKGADGSASMGIETIDPDCGLRCVMITADHIEHVIRVAGIDHVGNRFRL